MFLELVAFDEIPSEPRICKVWSGRWIETGEMVLFGSEF